MSEKGTLAIFVGTHAGLYRFQAGALTPLCRGTEPVTALAALPGGRLVAGTGAGELLRLDRDGSRCNRGRAPGSEPITSILHVPGRTPLLLAATARGQLLASVDFAATFQELPLPATSGRSAPVRLYSVPGRPRAALLLVEGGGTWHAADVQSGFEPWCTAEHGDATGLLDLVAHPTEGHLWLARTRDRVLRSTNGARTFDPLAAAPADLRPRALHFSPAPPHPAFVVTWPRSTPPDPVDPSPLWISRDHGQSFHPLPSRLIDRARDPSGEITAITSFRENDSLVVLLGTDRGELLEWRAPDRPATLLASSLPPIQTLLPLTTTVAADPSTSGIYLLP